MKLFRDDNEKGKRMTSSTRTALLICALVLIVIAVVLRIIVTADSLSGRIVREMKAHGCTVNADELSQQVYKKHASISSVMEGIDMTDALAASLECGFPSDMLREGELYLLLAQLDDEHILTVFVINEEVEFAFIQITESDEVLPINAPLDFSD